MEYSHQTSTALVAGGLVGCVKWTPDGDAQCVTQGLFIARYNVDNGAWLEGEVWQRARWEASGDNDQWIESSPVDDASLLYHPC